MGGVIFFDHFNACATIFSNLINVRAFHEAQTNISMSQAVGGAALALAVELESFFFQDNVEKLLVPFWE